MLAADEQRDIYLDQVDGSTHVAIGILAGEGGYVSFDLELTYVAADAFTDVALVPSDLAGAPEPRNPPK